MDSDNANVIPNAENVPEKYYQVFISSTKEDLQEEREALELELLGTRFLPFGMERFLAFDGDIWQKICRKIDESDFFVLIIAGRYGSIIDENIGMSYTRKEYEYALQRGKRILAFVKDRSALTGDKMDTGKEGLYLEQFIKEIHTPGRFVKPWRDKAELLARVSNSLSEMLQELKQNNSAPVGWVRGNYSPRLKETVMNFYNIYMKITGTIEDCETGKAVTTYLGSAQVDSPDRPIVYDDFVQTEFGIIEHHFSPPETVANKSVYERNPKTLKYYLVSDKNADKLRFTGKIVVNTQLRQIAGGTGLHIPYFAEFVTIFLDISSVPFVFDYNPHSWVKRRDEDGIEKRFDEAKTSYDAKTMTYTITARNVPADSDIEFSWGDVNKNERETSK